jgi:hypothetical protein
MKPIFATFSFLCASALSAQTAPTTAEPQLRTRSEVAAQPQTPPAKAVPGEQWVIPQGTKIPMELRQPLSTKNAQPGDSVYAQTTFPVVVDGKMAIPAGTWVRGKVDMVKRAGRIKGTAEMQFHLTQMIYPNGYTLDMAAAVDQVPGENPTRMKEPGTVKQESEKGKDVEKVISTSAQTAQIGAIAGAASGSFRGFGYGGLSGIAVGTLIGLLARGSDVTFPAGTAVEIALTQSMAVEATQVLTPGTGTAPLRVQ